ncbi:hypothetical protein [Thiosulfatihalobacter marinus]|jgi:hypothetical protein|uniref:hypothetical protein n=1 Tax=Thiosulfatihalobacter marinus TaxID=2792481 RepID=UPI0018D8E585|nr:hypothetical protein [Thiosulfatihalobacter marinus]
MSRLKLSFFVLGVLVMAGPAAAQAFGIAVGGYRLQTNPLPGNSNFEVIIENGAGPRLIWCEAGNYATARLRSSATARLYLLNPRGPAKTRAKRNSVGFTLDPSPEVLEQASRPGQANNYSVSITEVGYNLSVGHTKSFCDLGIMNRF